MKRVPQQRRYGGGTCWSTMAPNIRVCRTGSTGHIDVSNEQQDRWLVLRVGGPHPQVVLFARETESSWMAPFRLCHTGTYTLHVRAMLQKPWSAWMRNWTSDPMFPPCQGSWTSGELLQESFYFDGHRTNSSCALGLWSWPASVAVNGEVGALLERITPSPHPNRSSLSRLFGALTFSEASSTSDASPGYHSPPALMPQSTAPSRTSLRLCVVGDSQMRTLADGIAQHIAEGDDAKCKCRMASPRSLQPCNKNLVGSQACMRRLCVGYAQNVSVTYFRANYGNELGAPWPRPSDRPLIEHLAEACNTVLLNSGQWWASWKPKPSSPSTARTPAQYRIQLEPMMAHIRALTTGSKVRAAWVATNPYPVNAGGSDYTWFRARPYDMSVCPARERRFPHVLHAYNEEAKLLAATYGVDFLDTWQIALPLFDLSEDGAHYARGLTPVGRAQVARVMRWVLYGATGSTCSALLQRKPLLVM
jgi:hypothetical protein